MTGVNRNQNPNPQPFLNIQETMEFAGLSRRMLDNYTDAGICQPGEPGAKAKDKHWTFDQAARLSTVPTLKHGGMKLEEIARTANSDAHEMPRLVYSQLLHDMRETRRALKSIVQHNRRMYDIEQLGFIDGKYLRYIPQRWLALIPARDGGLALPGSRPFIQLVNELRTVIEVVGWNGTSSVGSLSSISLNGRVSSYATVSLASPPMPTGTGGMVIDGGCYHSIDPQHGEPHCSGDECYLCSRFGRTPTDQERAHWDEVAAAHPDLWDDVVMLDDLEKPYATGMWSGFTRQKLDARANGEDKPYDHDGSPARRKKDGWRLSVRPRLMPHVVKLPLGVTACVIPAGMYLCCQCDEGAQSPTYHSILGSAEIAHFEPFSESDEVKAYERTQEIPRPQHMEGMPGPHIEEFAKPRSPGDPRLAGWSRAIPSSEIASLTVPTNMALYPEDGYCALCSALPAVETDRPARYEIQLLVDYPVEGIEKSTPPPERFSGQRDESLWAPGHEMDPAFRTLN